MKIKVNISVGEYIDKYSILKIKEEKGLNVKAELNQYKPMLYTGFNYYLNIMIAINSQLWDLEDIKRKGVERLTKEESDTAFLITQLNDLRHETKKRIDTFFYSDITEKKSH